MDDLEGHPDVAELTHLYPLAGDSEVWNKAVALVARWPYMDIEFLWVQALPVPGQDPPEPPF